MIPISDETNVPRFRVRTIARWDGPIRRQMHLVIERMPWMLGNGQPADEIRAEFESLDAARAHRADLAAKLSTPGDPRIGTEVPA